MAVLPKGAPSLPKELIGPPEMRKLLQAPDVTTDLGFRDRTMLEVLWSTGIRVSELAAIRVEDVDLDGRQVRIERGKAGRTRVVPLGTMACAWVGEYGERVRPGLVRDDAREALFLSRTGMCLDKTGIEWMVRSTRGRWGFGRRSRRTAFG